MTLLPGIFAPKSKKNVARTKFFRASKQSIRLIRRLDGPQGYTIEISMDFGGAIEPLSSGIGTVDRVLEGIRDIRISIGVKEGAAGADKNELIKNVGLALGEAVRRLIEKRKTKESASVIRSDGNAMCMFAINAKKQPGEANLQIIGKPEHDFDPEHFFAFFDGLAQGMEAEVNAVADFGELKKGQIDLISKAFASSLKQILGKDKI